MRVLVIEDDDDVTLLYRLALEHAGHEVEAVALGEQGVRVALDHRPDVILLDGMLPDIDGLVVLDQLRADPATASIPVVMASARVGGTDRRAALERGATAYVMKPFQPGDIADLVAKLGTPDVGAAEAPRRNGTTPHRSGAGAAAPAVDGGSGDPLRLATTRLSDPALLRLLDLARDAIISIDAQQHIIGFNKGAERAFGYLAEEVLGKPLGLLLPEGMVAEHQERVPRLALPPGASLDMGAGGYVYGRRRDGSTFPVEASVTNVEVDGHTVLTAIVRDATDRQRVEAELQARIAQQVALADLSLRAITSDDMSALYEDAVATVARVLDVDLVNLSVVDVATAELVLAAGHGWTSSADVAPRCSTEPGSLGAATLASEGPVVFDDVTDDGRFSAPPHLVAEGVTSGVHVALRGRTRPMGLLGIYSRSRRRFTDEDVHAVRAIANVVASAVQRDSQNRRIRAYLDAAPDATLIVAPSGAILSANAQAEVLFGYRREELLRLGVEALVPEGARARHGAHRAAYAAERRPRPMGENLQLSAQRKDGTQVPVDIMLRPVETDEGPLVVAAVRDITDRRRNEAARDAFLHAVSHELRTPLTSVLGFSALLLDRYGDELSPEALDLARRIRASGGKLERLLGDMLDLDRLGRGVLEARRSVVVLRGVFDRALEAVELEGRQLSVVVEPEDLQAAVDPIQVERILENLVLNAVRHTPPTSSVWVRVSRSANGILLVVEDDGPGVPPESQGEIFEPFRRGPGVVAPGTGIGLSLVARFAELHGGRAWVEERAGGGSSFRVVLAT